MNDDDYLFPSRKFTYHLVNIKRLDKAIDIFISKEFTYHLVNIKRLDHLIKCKLIKIYIPLS